MQLRDRHEHLQGLGVKVCAISVDSIPSLRVFDAAQSEFPFPLAADWHRDICRQYGVLNEESQVADRVLMLCDSQGRVVQVVNDYDPAQVERMDHVIEAARHVH